MLLCGVAPLRSTSTQKTQKKNIMIIKTKKFLVLFVPFCVLLCVLWALLFFK